MYARNEKPESPIDLSKVIDLSIEYCQNNRNAMPFMDIQYVRAWVNEGCDIEQDILPVMKEIMGKKRGITAYKYFCNPVYTARDKRLIKEKYEAEKPAIDCEAYIKIYQWKRDRGMPLKEVEAKALQEYEARA